MRLRMLALSAVFLLLGLAMPLLAQQTYSDNFVSLENYSTDAASAVTESPDATGSPYAGPLCSRSNLTGNWFGYRDALACRGITFYGDLTQYYQGVASGGNEQEFVFGWRGDYLLDIDFGKLAGWQGLTLDLRGESRLGQDTTNIDGTLSPTNIALLFPYPNSDNTGLTGVQFTQVVSEELLVFAGKINIFDGTPATYAQNVRLGKFWNAALAFNLAAIFVPPSTLGAGFVTLKEGEPSLTFMVLDTNYTPTTSGFETAFDNGVLLYGEYAIKTNLWELPGHSAVGFVYSNAERISLEPNWWVDLPAPGGSLPTESDTWTLMYRCDQVVYADPCDPKRNWLLLGQMGISDGNPNPIEFFFSLGVMGNGPLRSRPGDTMGFGYYHIGVTDAGPLDTLGFHAEDGLELYYNIAVTPWFHLTPDLQVIDPANSANETALLLGLRGRITF